VGWFAEVTIAAAARFDELVARAEGLARSWTERLADLRADAAARRLLPHLVGTAVIDVQSAARLIGVSQRAIRTAMGVLVERRILTTTRRAATAPGRPAQLWIASDALKLLE